MLQGSPSRWTIRPSQPDDAAAMVAMFNERLEAVGERPRHTKEGLLRWFEQPTHPTLETDCVIYDESGILIGWAGLTEAPPPYKKLLFSMAPRVALEGCEALWDVLSAQLDVYARNVVRELPTTERPILRTFCLLRDVARHDALVRNGYALARVQNKMRIDLAEAPPPPVWPDGIHVVPFDYEADVGRVVTAYQEAFRDHWGIAELPHADEVAKWREEHRWEGDEYDETMWYPAMDGDEIAGFARWWAAIDHDFTRGYLYNFFVRKPWRGRGLGTAILSHAVTDLYQRGYKSAELHVDSESLTNAPRVYERVGFEVVEQQYIVQKEITRDVAAE